MEIAFDAPLAFDAHDMLLLDVTLTLAPGARVAATRELAGDALVDGESGDRMRPIVGLATTGGVPGARSRWYDSGCASPRWLPGAVAAVGDGANGRVIVEFQVARGVADDSAESGWTTSLDELPPWRFVRFRVRFEGVTGAEPLPGLDSVTMPFVRTRGVR